MKREHLTNSEFDAWLDSQIAKEQAKLTRDPWKRMILVLALAAFVGFVAGWARP
jgi:hypothetical protein